MQSTYYHTFFKTQSPSINSVVSKTCQQGVLIIRLFHLLWRTPLQYQLLSIVAITCALVSLLTLRNIYLGKSNS